ncbi:hypothetical protein HHK36_001774 [Tetracentron sinense]|uniref:Pentatricopeptide repeat-containing protein n=1 Tax=Tetracentron sinense TaxID=13715 RepID=A0A835A3A8_TETSI|nr:hypothetical protein HHK36_001774 [Tetracentron sinense]
MARPLLTQLLEFKTELTTTKKPEICYLNLKNMTSLESSVKVFNKMTRNLISWTTTLISAIGGLHGYAGDAHNRFRGMELLGFKPDGVALMAMLLACRHIGSVEEGMELYGRMKGSYGVEP